MRKHKNSPNVSLESRLGKYRRLTLKFIVKQVEKGTGLSLSDLKEIHSEERLFSVALWHVTTTKKALCMALDIPVEAGCRYKRTLEKEGYLVQSVYVVICPFTNHIAHEISTNPEEFGTLGKSNDNQLNFFD
jgi:hypothetical protein